LKRISKENQEKGLIRGLVIEARKKQTRMGVKKVHKRIRSKMNAQGIRCSRDKLYDVLRESRMLIGKKKSYTKTTQSYHRFRKHPNLIKDIAITRSEQVWVSDITYVKTREKSMYLSLITDAYSKRIMGWSLTDNLKTINCITSLQMAIKNRRYPKRDLIHHSDRGLQYCSPDYIKQLEKHGIGVSMTTKHDPYENAIAERVNGILKTEFDIEGLNTGKEAMREIKSVIGIYNYERLHLSCNYQTPWEAHLTEKHQLKSWSRKFSRRDISLLEN
jgi:putative transposase